jgi:hypothetical protein
LQPENLEKIGEGFFLNSRYDWIVGQYSVKIAMENTRTPQKMIHQLWGAATKANNTILPTVCSSMIWPTVDLRQRSPLGYVDESFEQRKRWRLQFSALLMSLILG